MAVNALLVLVGAICLSGVGVGAATISNMPYGGMHYGGCPGNGCGHGGMMHNGNGQCGPANPACDPDNNGTCPGYGSDPDYQCPNSACPANNISR